MASIIPEKMVEIWTAHALVRHFGKKVQIWAPPRGADQAAAPSKTGKSLWLELKAPIPPPSYNYRQALPSKVARPSPLKPTIFSVDIHQLDRYHYDYSHPSGELDSEIIYVFPAPCMFPIKPSKSQKIRLTGQRARNTFAKWTYVARTSRLRELLDANGKLAQGTARIHLKVSGSTCHLCVGHSAGIQSGIELLRLDRFFGLLGACTEPNGMAYRGDDDTNGPVDNNSDPIDTVAFPTGVRDEPLEFATSTVRLGPRAEGNGESGRDTDFEETSRRFSSHILAVNVAI